MNQKFFRRALFVFIGAAAVLLFIYTPAIAAEEKESVQKDEETTSTEQATPSVSGAKIARDPDGAVRPPTEKEDRELAGRVQQTLKKYQRHEMKVGQNGNSLVIAPHNFRWSVATIGPDGKIKHHCVENTEKMGTVLNSSDEPTPEQKDKE